ATRRCTRVARASSSWVRRSATRARMKPARMANSPVSAAAISGTELSTSVGSTCAASATYTVATRVRESAFVDRCRACRVRLENRISTSPTTATELTGASKIRCSSTTETAGEKYGSDDSVSDLYSWKDRKSTRLNSSHVS